ncbi:putative Gonadal family, tetratricopeptide-like helical domain superfamily [Plasmopara halstedii]
MVFKYEWVSRPTTAQISMADNSTTWDASGVVAQAKALILSSNYIKVEDARKEVDDTLSRWVSSVQAMSDDQGVGQGKTAVVALWRQYAALEMELRQFKQATKVFERAVTCPVAGSSMALWLQYADFCVERKRFSNARKVFIRALEALPEQEHTAIWARFFGFVCTHVDGTLSLATLQHQVMPDKFPNPGTSIAIAPSGPSAYTTPPVAVSTLTNPLKPLPNTLQPLPLQAQANASTSQPVSAVDPAVAFIDTTGEVTSSPSPLAVDSVGLSKRKSVDLQIDSDAKRGKSNSASTATAYFVHLPLTLPFIPSCSRLLFDSVADGEAQKQIGNELLERLSDVLGDSAVFEGVRDLRDNQRSRDREMLYRWQELVGMQMKEGSELFARHMALEMQHGFSDPRGLIALKTQHLEQRREFSNRCQMSQQQFVDICALDRADALKAQQISLENMKIPEMTVTTDADAITLQRGIVGLILEAEKLWREENQPSVDASNKKSQQPPVVSSSRGPTKHRRDSQDSTASNHSSSRSASGAGPRGSSRQDLRSARNHGNNSTNRRRDRDARGGRGRSNKWDIQPPQSNSRSPALASPHTRYEYAGPDQQMPLYDRGPQQMQASLQQPRHFQQQPFGVPPYHDYGGRQGAMSEQQGYVLQPTGPYSSGPPNSLRPRGEGDCLVGQGGPSRGSAAWPQQQPQSFHQQPQPLRQHTGPLNDGDDFRPPYDPSLSRYGAASGTGPLPPSRDGPDPVPYGDGRRTAVPTALYYHESPSQQSPYHPPHQHPSQQPSMRHENYPTFSYDQYGFPQGEFQQRGGRPVGSYGPGEPPQDMMTHHPPQQRYQQDQLLPSPAPAGMNSNRRNRRGGGRYRR